MSTRVLSAFAAIALVAACLGCSAAERRAPPQARAAGAAARVRLGRTEILAPRPAPPPLRVDDGYPSAVVAPRPMTRVHRGDFEPPATLVIVYERDWVESIEQIIRATAGQARVLLLGAHQHAQTDTFRELGAAAHVDVLTGDFDVPWVRDYGPLQTYELASGPLWLDLGYVGDRAHDDQLPSVLSTRMRTRLETPGVDFDGGAVISNGQGLCALTRTSLRDADFAESDAGELERFLASLGCHATAIVPSIPREPTGHVDVVAQFLAADLVMVAWLDAGTDPELARALDGVAESLSTTAELAGYPLQIVRIPLEASGETFFSYVNATRLRTRLLVPRFNDLSEELERAAHSALALALPEVSIVPIDADVMVRRGGAIHCITLGLGPTAAPAGLDLPP